MAGIIYSFLREHQSTVYSGGFGFIFSCILDVIQVGGHSKLEEQLIFIAAFILLMYHLATVISKRVYDQGKNSVKLKKFMNHYTDRCFNDVSAYQGFSWGMDKTLYIAPNIFEGIRIDHIEMTVITHMFEYESGNYHDDRMKENCNSDKAKAIIKAGNNCPRYMLEYHSTNYTKDDRTVTICMRKTDYVQASATWDYFRNLKPREKQPILNEVFFPERKSKKNREDMHAHIYPNSFCLHLIIELKNRHMLLAQVSPQKSNDYPSSWAATIGEQIEGSDFLDHITIKQSALKHWVHRALREEFGFTEEALPEFVSDDSIRALALTFEGDIYNFALVAVVKLDATMEGLSAQMHKDLTIDKEISLLGEIQLDDIPDVLVSYNKNKPAEQQDFHPSAYLQMFLYYVHKRGIDSLIDGLKKSERIQAIRDGIGQSQKWKEEIVIERRRKKKIDSNALPQ